MKSFVVTGGGQGVGRAVVERLLADGHQVVAVDLDPAVFAWTGTHAARERISTVIGDASDEAVATLAAERARGDAPLAGWVNNAAVFRDVSLHSAGAPAVIELIGVNLNVAVVGCAVAVGAFLDAGTAGSIVNVSSHQAQRPVPGCLPYATAKAAIEGLTRALAVDYGPYGIRANAVALGTIAVERYEHDVAHRGDGWARDTGMLHALERVGQPAEAAATIAHLLSDHASFVSGATIPVDGGRAALAREP